MQQFTLLLRLAAPLQSWGCESHFDYRRTGPIPTKSGVVGLIAAAIGITREQDAKIQKLASSTLFGVRVDQPGEIIVDYQTVKGFNFLSKGTAYVTQREYLTDAAFLVGLSSTNREEREKISKALQHPQFQIYLGRKSCPATLPLVLGIRECDLESALRSEPRICSKWSEAKQKPECDIFIETQSNEYENERFTRYVGDYPLSFSLDEKKFGLRAETFRKPQSFKK